MRFLLHGPLDPAAAAAIVRHGHKSVSMAEAVLEADIAYADLIEQAHSKQLDLLTADRDLARFVRVTPLRYDRSLVYLQLPGGDVEQDDAIDRLFARYQRLKPRMIYTVTQAQVKVSQMKG